MGGIREVLGSRTFLGYQVLPNDFEPWLIMILPAGAFIVFGLLMGFQICMLKERKILNEIH